MSPPALSYVMARAESDRWDELRAERCGEWFRRDGPGSSPRGGEPLPHSSLDPPELVETEDRGFWHRLNAREPLNPDSVEVGEELEEDLRSLGYIR